MPGKSQLLNLGNTFLLLFLLLGYLPPRPPFKAWKGFHGENVILTHTALTPGGSRGSVAKMSAATPPARHPGCPSRSVKRSALRTGSLSSELGPRRKAMFRVQTTPSPGNYWKADHQIAGLIFSVTGSLLVSKDSASNHSWVGATVGWKSKGPAVNHH